MKQCIAVRHVHFEHLGAFEPVLADWGYEIAYLQAGIDDLSPLRSADLGVFLGGPLGVYEDEQYPFLRNEVDIAAHRLEEEKPSLGICLGAQVLAKAAGARVYPGWSGKEIGWKPIHLTAEGAESVIAPLGEGDAYVLHWHGDTFDLPAGAVWLASTESYEHQAYAIGNHTLAFQFHPEIPVGGIEPWLIGHAVEIAQTPGIDPARIRQDADRYGEGLAQRGPESLKRWLSQL